MKKDLIYHNMEEIKFDNEARELLLEGVNDLNNAVSKTMGPNGSTVIIPSDKEHGKYIVTKDGVSVAKAIKFKNPYKNIGAQLIKQAAEQTVKEAGDGTTTATVLATAFVNNLKDFEYNDVQKAFDEIIPKVIKQLEDNSKKLNKEDIIHVAKISANNDNIIAEVIQDAYNHSSIVKVEESNSLTDKLELIDGMNLMTGYMSKHFETNEKRSIAELDNPHVLIIDGKIENIKPLQYIFEQVAVNNESLLIICEHINENILRALESNVLSQNIKLCVMKSPGFSTHRKNLLDDIAEFTKSHVIKDLSKPPLLTMLGRLRSATIGDKTSILTKVDSINIDNYVEVLESKLKDVTEDYEKELLEQRINNLKASVSIIKVGGKNELEMKERFDRYDDAIKAVACALEEGIVAGAGSALVHISFKYEKDDKLILQICHALRSPNRTIYFNMGLSTREISGMFEQNIIDPLKVTRCALLNAVSVAKVILSTEAVVLNSKEWMK